MLGREVVLKYTPRIKFELNDAIAEGEHVISILEELEEENEGDKNP
jgi:ribosome-binding factor A